MDRWLFTTRRRQTANLSECGIDGALAPAAAMAAIPPQNLKNSRSGFSFFSARQSARRAVGSRSVMMMMRMLPALRFPPKCRPNKNDQPYHEQGQDDENYCACSRLGIFPKPPDIFEFPFSHQNRTTH